MRGFAYFVAQALALAVVGMPWSALAAPNKQACVTAYEETQIAMRRSRLRHAREALQTCLNEACPAVLRSDCAGWLKEVEARTPSVVVESTSGGSHVTDARLFVDGELHPSGIDGKAMELEPGTHSFRVEASGAAPVTVEAIIREGEKLKVVRVEIPTTTPSRPQDPTNPDTPGVPGEEMQRPVPWTVYAAAGVGVAAMAGFSIFAISGSSMKSDLDPCKPDCTEAQLSDVRTQFIVADVFLGVTALAIGAAAYLFLTRPTVSSTTAMSAWSPASRGSPFAVGGGRLSF
jgi:hypothetical protein